MSAPGFSAGERHGWLDRLCIALEAVLAGEQAAKTLAAGAVDDGLTDHSHVSVVRLPMWIWRLPSIDVGRKAAARGGGSLLLPIRLQWREGPLRILAEGTHRLGWEARGMGYDLKGVAEVAAVRFPNPPAGAGGLEHDRLEVGLIPAGNAARELERIATDGDLAWWQASGMIEPILLRALHRAHAVVGGDLRSDGGNLIDPTDIEIIRDNLVLGDGARDSSHIGRLLSRCLAPQTFTSVDPMRYITASLRRDAEEALRRHIGDPRLGPKIRRLAEEMGDKDVRGLVDAYNARYPSDHLGASRAEIALEIGRRPPATTVPIGHLEAVADTGLLTG